MKLYRVPSMHGSFSWAGTQADAKKIAKELHAPGWEDVDVPVDKPSLLTWLNENCTGKPYNPARDAGTTPVATGELERLVEDGIELAELRAVAAQQPATTMSRDEPKISLVYLEDFILDKATAKEVEHLFACLGARFREATHGTS